MNYKADFEPCELLCPKSRRFVELTPKVRAYITANRKYLDDEPIDAARWKANEFADINDIQQYIKENCFLYDKETNATNSLNSSPQTASLVKQIAKIRKDIYDGMGKKLSKRMLLEL